MSIPKIVLTGGPCAGKSKALKRLKTELNKVGFTVIDVCEAAQDLISQGVNRNNSYEFQKEIALYQIEKEKEAEILAEKQINPVIICDRGLMDCKVYLNDNDFIKIKQELNLTDIDLRDSYNAVFHLDSTATSDYYKKGEVRIESNDEAIDLNNRSLRAWCGNPHYRFIPVAPTFDEKMNVLLKKVLHFLGYPKPLEIERKYLIRYPDIDYLKSLPSSKSEISQTYCIKDGERFRLRKRGENGHYIYFNTKKRKISDLVYEEIETTITEDEYNFLLSTSEHQGSISKVRYCLMYNEKYYEIDIFPFWKNQAYLEIELDEENEKFLLPDFIKVIEDVTFKREYKNSSLCKKVLKEIIV